MKNKKILPPDKLATTLGQLEFDDEAHDYFGHRRTPEELLKENEGFFEDMKELIKWLKKRGL